MNHEHDDRDKLEQEMAHSLEEGDMEKEELDAAARRRLSPRYEIRIQAKLDPVVEETRLYRQMAKEVDGRYDKYKIDQNQGEEPE
ncbi:hypothetical protein N6H14_31065 [Paenibacillus sp. CC-CFT747]|nr:hypothetical protein N6H14_31065 [Paenibacillus sp. CC-CFT747]